MFDLGTKEIIVLAAVLLLLLGAGRIPALAKDIKEIKKIKKILKK